MINAALWRECGCWCLFSTSAIMILLLITLILNDISLVSEHQAFLNHIINTPISRLNCDQICPSWYTVENKEQCCDPLNINLCVSKEHCKKQYQKQAYQTIEQLQIDKLYKMLVALACTIIVAIVFCHKRKVLKVQESQSMKQEKMKKMLGDIIKMLQQQKVIDSSNTNYKKEHEIIENKFAEIYQHSQTKSRKGIQNRKYRNEVNQIINRNQNNEGNKSHETVGLVQSYVPAMQNIKKMLPRLKKKISSHSCEKCVLQTINEEV